jgi:hypothetical protein
MQVGAWAFIRSSAWRILKGLPHPMRGWMASDPVARILRMKSLNVARAMEMLSFGRRLCVIAPD